jgi:hypothetical protein
MARCAVRAGSRRKVACRTWPSAARWFSLSAPFRGRGEGRGEVRVQFMGWNRPNLQIWSAITGFKFSFFITDLSRFIPI